MRQEIRLVLSDHQWKRIEKLCVGKPGDPGGIGANNRMFVEAALWIARTGSPWRDLATAFGKWNSVFVRFNWWSQGGLWQRIFATLADDPDFETNRQQDLARPLVCRLQCNAVRFRSVRTGSAMHTKVPVSHIGLTTRVEPRT